MITSTMQDDFPLTVTAMLEHGTAVFPDSECVTWQGDGTARRATITRDRRERATARRRASPLSASSGVTASPPCAGTARNTSRPICAVPCMGAVLHTLNLRLPPAQLALIANHAEDKIVVVDATLLPLLAAFSSQLEDGRGVRGDRRG